MAWNRINYACKHGSYDVEMDDNRENYVKWAERNIICEKCYKNNLEAEQKIIDEKETRIKALASEYDGIYTTDEGDIKIEVVSETEARVTITKKGERK